MRSRAAAAAWLALAGACASSRTSHASPCSSDEACPGGVCRAGACVPGAAPRPAPPTNALRAVFTVALDERVFAEPAVCPDGTVLVVTGSGRVLRLDDEGRIRDEARLGITVRGAPAVDLLGRIAIPGTDGRLRLLDRNLEPLAEVAFEEPLVGPVTALTSGLFAVSTRGLSLVTGRGAVVLRVPAASQVLSRPLELADGTLVFGTPDGALVAVTVDGRERFRVRVDAGVYEPPVSESDGSVVVSDVLGHLHRFAADGTLLTVPASVTSTDGSLDFRFGPIHAPGHHTAASRDGTLRILGEDLELRATFPLPGHSILVRPTLDDAANTWFATSIGLVVGVDANGRELARTHVGADVRVPLVFFPRGTLLAVTDDGVARGFR